MMEISHSQLALYNGIEKDQIWIAYKGQVYDVTASWRWRDGQHFGHWAGQDLTDELKDAPHAEEVFKRFPQVAVIKS